MENKLKKEIPEMEHRLVLDIKEIEKTTTLILPTGKEERADIVIRELEEIGTELIKRYDATTGELCLTFKQGNARIDDIIYTLEELGIKEIGNTYDKLKQFIIVIK